MKADDSRDRWHAEDPGALDVLGKPLRTEPFRPTGDAADGWGRAAAYDAYGDGLHTYAIWSLGDHDAAVDALYCAFVIADRNVTQLRQPDHIQPWLYAILRHECHLRSAAPRDSAADPAPVSWRLHPPAGAADPTGSLAALERNLRRAEFHSLEWPESEGLDPAHREILELTIRHGLDSNGLGLVLGLGQGAARGRETEAAGDGDGDGADAPGFGVLADAWRELERSLAAAAVAKASREHCARLAELTRDWPGRLTARLRTPLTDHVDACTRCQHYLHTVIGTPSAPTILPFIAAPRSLRKLVLAELRDPDLASRAGVDHDLIAARIRRFTPDGFPKTPPSPPGRGRAGRRAAAPRSGAARPGRTEPPPDVTAPVIVPDVKTGRVVEHRADTAAPRVWPQAEKSFDAESADFYCAPGSWAARVLPPDVNAHTPSVQLADVRVVNAYPAVPGNQPRPARRRPRPLRQAVLSAVALTAVGAAAATASALLGTDSDGHTTRLSESTPSQGSVSVPGGGGRLTASVSSAPLPAASSSAGVLKVRRTGVRAPGAAAGDPSDPAGGAPDPGSGPASGPSAAAADFHVSVNQRAADPNSVTILLRNTGSAPVSWQATPQDSWIVLSRGSGTLDGGQSLTITATATAAAPTGPWTSKVAFAPGGSVVVFQGGSSDASSAPASPSASGGATGSTPPGSPSGGSTAPAPPTADASAHSAHPAAARLTHTVALRRGGSRGSAPSSPAAA
ncbi:sigma-70 family RNA polymerase sigma factor [Actinocrinis puniceicyclus]|uniref:Sigma-70 family RNA polymerase sigma factor n=1 Tax=Actinocrinis puniceicyclus TaxID=977794 RepID=A0A8J7WPE5_9ACTN|nr:sigma-70 family RNA polymerase sigma factor [Actinocrinis puniceicyclus]MBS2965043.1 sigma-70 family RNA polymerase sigma factor [Actinocrinis puniceicyclus]